jgi:hypothetical protein
MNSASGVELTMVLTASGRIASFAGFGKMTAVASRHE